MFTSKSPNVYTISVCQPLRWCMTSSCVRKVPRSIALNFQFSSVHKGWYLSKVVCLKISYVQSYKRKSIKQSNPYYLQEMKMKSDVVTSSKKKKAKINWCGKIDKFQIFGVFFSISTPGRVSYRLDPATSIQEQKYVVYRTLPVSKSGFCWLSQMVLFNFVFSRNGRFVCLSFLGVRH